SDIDALSDTMDPLVAAVALPADAANSLAINGAKLPAPRQIASAVAALPMTGVAKTETKPGPNILTSTNIDMIDVESEKLSSAQLSEPDFLDTEKMQARLAVIDQNGGSVMKDNLAPVFQQLNQPSVSATQNQSVAPSSLQTLQLPAQATSSQWGEALGEKVTLLLSNKLNIAEIRIDPPHLGKLDIQIQIKDDSASILINTQHAQTRELIESASIRLKEFLQEAGYTSVDVDVSHQEQSMAEGDVSAQDDDGQNENSDQHNLAAQDEHAELQQKEISFNVDDGRIDYFA
ncbi:MAG: flagellar hook-length control protein FliK, partial [Gammaproteobacteria bacterium]|nr:flagellar hook-length control protein FliK [Gammaproteobacteria bacterium]